MFSSRPTLVIFLIAAAYAVAVSSASAAVASPACAGNVCFGTMIVGGQAVQYAYTQHIDPNGEFRIRFNGGAYTTAQLISTIVFDLPQFSTHDKYANPTNGAVFLPEEDVNPGRTAYERSDANGCASCIVDQVLVMRYSGATPGAYEFGLTVIQRGSSGTVTGLDLFIDAVAPGNTNESDDLTGIDLGFDASCADAADNELDYATDCADAQCDGRIGRVTDGASCEQPERTCSDDFDNDADGLLDCLDPDCDGRIGRAFDGALCQFRNERGASTCGDDFDNDADGKTDCLDNDPDPLGDAALACWKRPDYGCPATEISCTDSVDNDKDKSYDDAYDTFPLTGVDCKDYDCAGNSACPAIENRTSPDAGSEVRDEQCFDGLDNDLDRLIDCADKNDCLGVLNPLNPSQACYDNEFSLAQRFQFCANVFDDDGDGPADCADDDCKRKFGDCGPCPSEEDITFDACADGRDNDSDALIDCDDAAECRATGAEPYERLGALSFAAHCSAAENTADLCGDRFDNDRDTRADCADASCAGIIVCSDPSCAATYSCQPAGETACGDERDNDADGRIDCADPSCFGQGDCAPKNWTDAACQVVPRDTPAAVFTSSDPTITASVTVATRVNTQDVIRLTGAASYSSVTFIIGDNTDPTRYYPYAATPPSCTLVGANAAKLRFLAVPGHAVQIFSAVEPVDGFDVFFTCATPATPAALRIYPISLSALKTPGDDPETGDVEFSTTLFEAAPPSVTEVEPEGATGGVMRLPYGSSRRFRAVPNDPGVGLETSGICRCDVTIDGAVSSTPTGECVSDPVTFLDDDSVTISAGAEDGAGNQGVDSAPQNFTVNVTPATSGGLALGPAKPFFRSGAMRMSLLSEYLTAASGFFDPTCRVYAYVNDGSGNFIGGPIGPTAAFVGMPAGNTLRCDGSVTLPDFGDGEYFVTVRATDEDGDAAESARRAIYMCNTVPGPGEPENVCSKADFDGDGATEGLFTTLYTEAPKACDNCIGFSNDQRDDNANGVGDACEPDEGLGRCEVDREIVCRFDSDDVDNCPGDLCCPAPSIAPIDPAVPEVRADPQHCVAVFGLCTSEGNICFTDEECIGGDDGGFGKCAGDGVTNCKRDTECEAVGGPCVGADVCSQLLFPWLETVGGNIFSKKRILAPEAPPAGKFNATFCIDAKETILNFRSERCGEQPVADPSLRFDLPKQTNAYAAVLGRIDLPGILAGRYGEVVTVSSPWIIPNPLDGKVYLATGDLHIDSAQTVMNGAGTVAGNGTVVVLGGDLYIDKNVAYDGNAVTMLKQLASIGWLVLPDANGDRGNVFIDGDVQKAAGAFFAGGESIHTVTPPRTDSDVPLVVEGLMVGKRIYFNRSFKDVGQGSEKVIYDGRSAANPPPGFGDIAKSLPSLFVGGQ